MAIIAMFLGDTEISEFTIVAMFFGRHGNSALSAAYEKSAKKNETFTGV
jgi:hypothetical protein